MLRSLFIATCAVGAMTGDPLPQECRYEAERSATVDAAGAQRLVLEAGAGSLHVEGRAGTGEVRIRGRACASDEELLDRLDFEATRQGDAVDVRTNDIDDDDGWRERRYARLDLVIEVPAAFAATIQDGSGDLLLRDLGETSVHDGSGDCDISGVARLDIVDGSGQLLLREIEGDAVIEDGSGEIDVADIGGSITIEDGSGDIDLLRIGRNVRIDDSSGSISVDDVAGDFVVASDGGGGVRHQAVQGRIDVPRKGRRGS